MAVPDVVRATVLRRLQRLTRAERAVLMRASVIGRYFDLVLLAATAPCAERQLRSALERACQFELVVASDESGLRYAFRHALTRDIVYAELQAVRTRALHLRIARALERSRPDAGAHLEDLAYHAWAGGDARRTLRYNEELGDRAAAVHAREDARTYYARAQSPFEIGTAAYARLAEKLRDVADREPVAT